MDWSKLAALLPVIWSAVGPEVKAAALTELKALEAEEADKPLLELLLKKVEAAVAAA